MFPPRSRRGNHRNIASDFSDTGADFVPDQTAHLSSQHPTPIPLLHNLTPLIQSLRTSSLPFIRKLGYTISTPPSPPQGVLSRDEWDGAMNAWSNVEQRLGR